MYDFKKTEKEISEFWNKNKIYDKLMKRKGKSYFLLDGPPYANFIPHVGHIKNTVFKDLIIRLAFMKGSKVFFQPGFDTHGLPVENMVEKKLSLNSKKDIEKYGISKFMSVCKENAALNKDLWMDTYSALGSMYSLKDPYLTYEDYYIESGWWSFSQMHKKGMVYKGEKPVMWCSHCETSLAGYEVTDSYKDVSDPGIYILFKLKDSDENLLVYTTTPWTLPANVAVAISSNEDYVSVEIEGRKVILAEKRLEILSDMGFGYKTLRKFRGKELVGKKYEPLLDIPLQQDLSSGKFGKSHEIIASIPLLKERVASKVRTKKDVKGKDLFEDFVTMNEGTGFVHTAPGHGKTDYFIGTHYKLACVSPVGDNGEMIEGLTTFSGFVKNADKEIVKRLEEENKLFHYETITHSYPLCWRCKSPLIFRLSEQLFLKVDQIKKIIQGENKKVNWMPEFARERLDNWVDNAEDWNISRQRYWGIPIPIWVCGCGEEKIIENRRELEKLSRRKINDLHSVDDLKIKCKCGGSMSKFKGILDVWFDSGIAPWASLGYPHQNKDLFEEHFPVDRINEAQDQIRGWFYALIFCSSAIFNRSSYRSVSMTGWVVDSKGQKMSKSVGNVVTAKDALNELGADMLRYYFCWDVNPYDLQKFNFDIARKESGRIINVISNLKNLASDKKTMPKGVEEKWIISRLNSTLKRYQENIDRFELKTAMVEISDFILNDISRVYVKITRDKENSAVISLCLMEVLKSLAPIMPFVSEEIWQYLREKNIVKGESVHLEKWPKYNLNSIDKKLEDEMNHAQDIIQSILAERDKISLGVRWPLNEAVVHTSHSINITKEIIKKQANIKKLTVKKSKEEKIELDSMLTPELKKEGFTREIVRRIQELRKKASLMPSDKIQVEIITEEDLDMNLIRKTVNSEMKEIKNPKVSEKFKIKERDFEIKFNH